MRGGLEAVSVSHSHGACWLPEGSQRTGTDRHAAIWMGPGEQTGELGSCTGGGEGAARGKPIRAHVQCWPGEWGPALGSVRGVAARGLPIGLLWSL